MQLCCAKDCAENRKHLDFFKDWLTCLPKHWFALTDDFCIMLTAVPLKELGILSEKNGESVVLYDRTDSLFYVYFYVSKEADEDQLKRVAMSLIERIAVALFLRRTEIAQVIQCFPELAEEEAPENREELFVQCLLLICFRNSDNVQHGTTQLARQLDKELRIFHEEVLSKEISLAE